jgi:DNA-binding LacI/PurR family transcriptional regulator
MAEVGIYVKDKEAIFDRPIDGYGHEINFDLPENMPTAFVCNCDKTADILIEKLQAKGYKVPEDISVVGFDRYNVKDLEGLELTTYEIDRKALAQISVNMIIKRIEGDNEKKGIRIVEGRIIQGNTIRKL